jgi:hypothetical protein
MRSLPGKARSFRFEHGANAAVLGLSGIRIRTRKEKEVAVATKQMKKIQTRVEAAAWNHLKKVLHGKAPTTAASVYLAGAAWQRRECVRVVKEEFKYQLYHSPQTAHGKMHRCYADRAIAALKRSGKGK